MAQRRLCACWQLRVQSWALVIRKDWLPQRLNVIMLGKGFSTWKMCPHTLTVLRRTEQGVIRGRMSMPHNEFVGVLVEYGIIGEVFLIAMLSWWGFNLWYGGVYGGMLLIVGNTMIGVAMVNFPWSVIQHTEDDNLKDGGKKLVYTGCPSLVMLSLMLAILIHGVI